MRPTSASRRQARDILGAPFVPPPPVTRLVNAVRRSLRGAHRRSAPPSVRVLEAVWGLFDNRALGLLVELDIAERLDRPRALDELAADTGLDPDGLERLLRYAAGRGFVGYEARSGRYAPNDVTAILRADNVNSWRGWVEFATGDWFWDSWRHADAAVRGESSGIEAATGHPFFDYVTTVRPDAGRTFNDAMRAGAVVQAVALSSGLDWDGVRTVCDVGGGTGGALRQLLHAHPHLQGTLFDLPDVVAQAPAAPRVTSQGGSFFDRVPPDHDRYLLLAIVHDWDDEKATQILRTVRDAMPADGRCEAVVVENVLPEQPTDDFVVASDLLMLVLASGRERTRAQFHRLFAAAGLHLAGETQLATGFSAFRLKR